MEHMESYTQRPSLHRQPPASGRGAKEICMPMLHYQVRKLAMLCTQKDLHIYLELLLFL